MWDKSEIDRIMKLDVPTPFYCFDAERFHKKSLDIRRRLNGLGELGFSIKANPWMAETASSSADFLEVCSMGELRLCLENHIPASMISVGGVSKTDAECGELVTLRPRRISVESVRQLEALNQAAQDCRHSVRVLLRLTSGNQFGISMERIERILRESSRYAHICLEGIHYYAGTQKKNVADAEKLLATLIKAATEFPVREIAFGAGIGVPLFAGQSEADYSLYAQRIFEGIQTLSGSCHVAFECGRLLTYDCGIYVTTVLDAKQHGERNFLITDGGIHQLSYHGQIGGRPLPHILTYPDRGAFPMRYTVCGSLCTVSDILAKDVALPEVNVGDKLIFLNTGAYSVTESRSLFLSRELPSVALLERSGAVRIRASIPTYSLNTF